MFGHQGVRLEYCPMNNLAWNRNKQGGLCCVDGKTYKVRSGWEQLKLVIQRLWYHKHAMQLTLILRRDSGHGEHVQVAS